MNLKTLIALVLMPLSAFGVSTNKIDNLWVPLNFRYSPGAAAGSIFTSDAAGNASWSVAGASGDVFLNGMTTTKMNNYTAGTSNFFRGPVMLGNDNISPLIFISAGTAATNIVERHRMYIDTASGNVWKLDSTAGTAMTEDFGRITINQLFRTLDGVQIGDAAADALTVNSSAMAIPNSLNIGSGALYISNAFGIGVNAIPAAGNRFTVNTPVTSISSAASIFSGLSNQVPLVIEGAVSQVSNYFSIVTSAGTEVFTINSGGSGTLFLSGFQTTSTAGSSFGGGRVNQQTLTIFSTGATSTNLVIANVAGKTGPQLIIQNTNGASYFQVDPNGSTTIGTNALSALPFRAILTGVATLNFASGIAGAQEDLPITVSGTTTNDVASLGVPFTAAAAGGAFTAYTSNNTVYVRFSNATAGVVDPASAQFRATVIKY